MRRYFAVLLAAGVIAAAPTAAYADQRVETDPAAAVSPAAEPSKASAPSPSEPAPDPSPDASKQAVDPSAPASVSPPADPSADPSPSGDGGAKAMAEPKAETDADQPDPRLHVYDNIVVPGESLHVEGVGCELGTTAAIRGDGEVLGNLEVTEEEGGGTLFKGDVTIPEGWADGEHDLTATCGERKLGPVTVTVDERAVESYAQVDDTSVYPGQTIGFSGRCELEAPTVSVLDIATNTVLAEAECRQDGRFSGELTIPDSWVPGTEGSLGFVCLTDDGSTSGHRVDFTVTERPGGEDKNDGDDEGELQGGQLPFTGAAALPLLLGLGGALVVAGGLLLMLRRRGRSASEDTTS